MFHTVVLVAFTIGLAVPFLSVDASAQAETHCAVLVVDQMDDGELVVSEPVCYSDPAALAQWLEADSYQLAGAADGSNVGASSTFTLGIHYDGFNGTGSSISVVGSSCSGGWWNTGSTWANRISSSYNGCARLRHWDLPDKAGSSESTLGVGKTNNLTYMDNRTESVSYHSS